MLKKVFKGLGICFACSYSLAAPQNTIFLNDNIKRRNETQPTIISSSYYQDGFMLYEDDNIQFLNSFDILIYDRENAYISFTAYNENYQIEETLNYQFADDNTNNGTYHINVTTYFENLNNINTSNCYMDVSGFYTTLGYDTNNNNFYLKSFAQATFMQGNKNLGQLYGIGEDVLLKVEYQGLYLSYSNIYEFEDNIDNKDLYQYILNVEDNKILNFEFLNTINSFMQSQGTGNLQTAYNNGYMQGYDIGYNDGLQDNESAFNQGYELGIGDNIIPKNIIGWFRIISRGVQSVLDIEILPYMKVGYIISIPIMFGLILFIIRLVRGD